MANGQKLHTFCSLAWPGKAVWNRDIDKSADIEVIKVLSVRTGTPSRRAGATTLAAYEGTVFEKYNRYGPTPWIMPVGVYHRTRNRFGLQYCPRCLAEDRKPYYRRKWRLAFMVVCERHHAPLHDHCPRCGAAVNFHRNELGNPRKFAATSLTNCYACGFDLRVETVSDETSQPATPAEVEFTTKLLQAVDDGFMLVGKDEVVYSHLYFTGLSQLMAILAMRNKQLGQLRRTVSDLYGIETYTPPLQGRPPDIQEQGIRPRRQLLNIARCLLVDWPHRFIRLAQEHRVWSSLWLRHTGPCLRESFTIAPYWFWSTVHDYLYRARYCPSEEEILRAIEYLRRNGTPLNKSSLARLLGVAVIRGEINL